MKTGTRLMAAMAVGALLSTGIAAVAQTEKPTFDLRLAAPIVEDTKRPARERIDQGIAYLIEELATPSKPSWGTAGGPLTTGYVQSVIAGCLAWPGAEDPAYLRKQREITKDPRLRDLLTLPLGQIRDQSTVPDLVRIARTHPRGSIRYAALDALRELLKRPVSTNVPYCAEIAKTWKPYDAKTMATIRDAFIEALSDDFPHYRGISKDHSVVDYPLQTLAQETLEKLGVKVTHTEQGYEVRDSGDKLTESVRPKHRPNPADEE